MHRQDDQSIRPLTSSCLLLDDSLFVYICLHHRHPYFHLFICFLIRFPICVSLLSPVQPISLSAWRLNYLSIYPRATPYTHLPICLSIYALIRLSIHLSTNSVFYLVLTGFWLRVFRCNIWFSHEIARFLCKLHMH